MKCKHCGGPIKLRGEKLKVIAITTAMIAAVGAMWGTPVGWLALLAGASTPHAREMIRLKVMAMKASDQAGTYFECGDCNRQIGWGEFLSSL
jgi:hypothetical protein